MPIHAGADLVKRLRESRKLTQEELAVQAGLGLGMLQKIEQGHTLRPRPRNLEALDLALNADGAIIAAFPNRRQGAALDISPPGEIVVSDRVERLERVLGKLLRDLERDLGEDERLLVALAERRESS